jgi:hypothetical protein
MKTKSNVSKQGTSCVANMESVAVSVGNEPTELPVASTLDLKKKTKHQSAHRLLLRLKKITKLSIRIGSKKDTCSKKSTKLALNGKRHGEDDAPFEQRTCSCSRVLVLNRSLKT